MIINKYKIFARRRTSWRGAFFGLLFIGFLVGASFLQASSKVTISPEHYTPSVVTSAHGTAVWTHPTNPDLSVLIGSDRGVNGGLFAWTLEGEKIQQVVLGTEIRNLDIRSGFKYRNQTVDVVAGNLRAEGKVVLFALNQNYENSIIFVPMGVANPESTQIQPDTYGFALYMRPSDHTLYAFDRPHDGGHLRQYKIEYDEEKSGINVTKVRDLEYPGGITEGMVVDDEKGLLYVAREYGDIYIFNADPDKPAGVIEQFTPFGGRSHRRKGLALYSCDDGSGYLIHSNIEQSQLEIYERGGQHWFKKVVTLVGPNDMPDVQTNGLDVVPHPLPGFPNGLLAVEDSVQDAFYMYDWGNLMEDDMYFCDERPVNKAPVVEAGEGHVLTLPEHSIELEGTATDDGYPDPPKELSYRWTPVSGPPGIRIEYDFRRKTTVKFPSAGEYTLRLTVSDYDLEAFDEVTIRVVEPDFPGDINDDNNDDKKEDQGPAKQIVLPRGEYYPDQNGDLRFQVPADRSGYAQVTVKNWKGRVVKHLPEQSVTTGLNEIRWNGENDQGGKVSSGVYTLEINSDGKVQTQRIGIIRGVK